jgi:hypothetical protein
MFDEYFAELDAAKRQEMLAEIIEVTAETYTMANMAYVPGMYVFGPEIDIDIHPLLVLASNMDTAKHR